MDQIKLKDEIKRAADAIDDIKKCQKCGGKTRLEIDVKIKKWEARCLNRLCTNFQGVVRKDWK